MTHEVRLAPPARRALNRLPAAVAVAVIEFLAALGTNPHRIGKPLRAPLEGEWSARRGQYRVRYRIADDTVTVLDIKHRRDAYRT